MAIRILEDDDGYAALYCSTSMTAFGPVFDDGGEACRFLDWHKARGGVDVRRLSQEELDVEVHIFRGEESAKAQRAKAVAS